MIPIATTTITVARATAADAFDRGAPTTVASGVRAVISSPSGTETVTSGSSSIVTARLDCDPCDLRHGDRVTDAEGTTYEVSWVTRRVGYGLDHMVADLVTVTDRAAVT